MKYIITSSPGNSGGGAIHDYLLSRNDFVSPSNGEEMRLIVDPYGLENLYKNFYENFSINNAAEAVFQFENYCQNLKNDKLLRSKKVYGDKFFNLTDNFIKQIKDVEYIGLPQYKRISLNYLENFKSKINRKFFKYKHNQYKSFKMIIPVKEKVFIESSKKLFLNYINLKKIILDQATNY